MEEMLKVAGTYGFSTAVAIYLLVRLEQRMSELTQAIQRVCYVCERIERIEGEGSR